MERKIEFDIIKGIGIILVLLGHIHMFHPGCVLPEWLSYVIWTFHVPLFFFIAGYFSKSYDGNPTTVILKYFKRLVIPFLITALIVILYNTLLVYKHNNPQYVLGIIGSYLFGDVSGNWASFFGIPNDMGVGAVWFLMALFWAKSFFYFITRIGDKYACIVCVLLSWIFSIFSFPLPFFLRQGITALGFVAVGYWLKKHPLKWWCWLIIIICFISVQFYHVDSSPYEGYYQIYPINVLAALGGTYILYLVARIIAELPFISKFFIAIGSNTMNILCVHTMDMRCNAIRLVFKHIPILYSTPWLSVCCEYIIVIAVSFLPNIIQSILSYTKSSRQYNG